MQPDLPTAVDRLRQALSLTSGESSDFDLNAPVEPPMHAPRPAAVLVAVAAGPSGPGIVLTRRSAALRHHPGQVAFPGGKLDQGEDVIQAALREADEEVGLAPSAVRVLGTLPPHRTVTGYSVTPVLAEIGGFAELRPTSGEVDEVFSVPFAHLMNPANYRVEGRVWAGQMRRFQTVPWGPHYVWGATARILWGLALRVAQCD